MAVAAAAEPRAPSPEVAPVTSPEPPAASPLPAGSPTPVPAGSPEGPGGVPPRRLGSGVDLDKLRKQLEEERSKLQLFVLRAKQERADQLESQEKQERREREYYQAPPGDTCGPHGRFVVEEELGRGVFSTVCRCRDAETGGQYAIKFIRSNAMFRKATEKEVKLMGRICQQSAVEDPEGARFLLGLAFFEAFEHEGHLALVFELMKCDLRAGLIRYGQGRGLPLLPTVRNFARNLFCALRALRKLKVIHCDVKPENLLLSLDKASVKLSDFGAAMDMAERVRTDYMQPRFYRAPEVILGQSYSTQIDVWSAGVTLYEVATGRALFSGGTNNEMVHEMLKLRGPFGKEFATSGEFASKHFNNGGDFLNANGDFAINSANPAVIPMGRFATPDQAILKLMEAELKETPRGIDAARHQSSVRNFADLVERCLTPDPARRPTPEAVLAHRFFEKGA